jgi:hypothetical protein
VENKPRPAAMLACMSSLTSLVDHAAAPTFNTDFYVTAATVIPVLFLALILQTTAYDDLLKDTAETTERLRERYRKRTDDYFMAPSVLAAAGAPLTALLILFAGAAGELAAINALANRHATSLIAVTASSSVVLLTVAVVAAPFSVTLVTVLRLLSVMVLGQLGRLGPAAVPKALAGKRDAADSSEATADAPVSDPGAAPGETAPSGRGETGAV